MSKLNINIIEGGLGRQSSNTDTWGGLAVEVDALPVGWTDNEVKRIFRVEDLATYGIVEDAVNNYYKLVYWHVSEVFRIYKDATLYVQLATTANATAEKILPAFAAAESRLRMFGIVFVSLELTTANVALVQTQMDALEAAIQPARCIVTFAKEATDIIPDFSALDNYRVLVEAANDFTAGGLAKSIFDTLGMCGAAGTYLGQALGNRVHQQISWNSKPIDGGGRWLSLADVNGDSVEALTQTEIDALATQGVSIVSRVKRKADAYISNSRTAGEVSNDYAVLNNGRVIDKAIGLVYDAIQPELDGPIYTNPNTGALTKATTQRLKTLAYEAINTNMVIGRTGNDVELAVDPTTGSLSLDSVYIDPEQDVQATQSVTINIRLVPVGYLGTGVIEIGLVANI